MKRKTAILTVSYLCAALLFTGVYAALRQRELGETKRSCRYAADHAFEELCAAMTALDTALEKAALAATPGIQSALCSDAYAGAEAADAALSLLESSYELEKAAAFLDTAGDYARTLGRAAATGATWSETERGNLRSLAATAAWAAGELEGLRCSIAEGECCRDDTPEALRTLEAEFPEQTLIYDGAYSPRTEEPAMLAGKEETGEKEACIIAAAFLGESERSAACCGQSAGDGREWRVQLGDWTVLVSGRGGQVLRAVCERAVGEGVLSEDSARSETQKFLRSRGYGAMQEIAHSLQDGCLITEWCAVQQGVVCYPDRVRVALALDNGTLLAFEAGDYVRNHHARRFDLRETVSWEAAEAMLAPGLRVDERFHALILSPGGEERLCLAFRCTDTDGAAALIFASAATGSQERIALLREDEYGSYSV